MEKDGSSVEKITQAEYRRILSLPKRKFTIAGKEHFGLYDENSGRFYLLNNDNSFSGKTAIVKRTSEKGPVTAPASSEDFSKTEHKATSKIDKPSRLNFFKKKKEKKNIDDEFDDNDFEEVASLDKKKKIFFIGVSALVLIMVIAFILLPAVLGGLTSPSSPSANDESPSDGLETIRVIQIRKELLPGDIVAGPDIVAKDISVESYNVINLTGNALYQWEHHESVLGMVATAYIPAGQYLQHTTIAREYTPTNPWTIEAQKVKYVKIPIKNITTSIDGVVFGSVVDLSIDIKTVVRPHTVAPDETQLPDGMTYETSTRQSYVTDTYGMKAVVICDLLNADADSLFYDYAVFGAIPEAEQITFFSKMKEGSDYGYNLFPSYIVVALTDSQAKTLGNLSGDNVAIELTEKKPTSPTAASDEKTMFYDKSKILYQTLKEHFVKEAPQ